ncbi:hypothetical protein GOODEAATRI_029344 [Goodea atripinnis]|uniref:Uncharacterized protein n=1 Tax=Goodea atripinnis TaxID=208336 RepID=A0ABV0P8R1_9TELE
MPRVRTRMLPRRHSASSWPRWAPHAEAEGVVSKVKVKKEIKTIVENLETILGDLKDVSFSLSFTNPNLSFCMPLVFVVKKNPNS